MKKLKTRSRKQKKAENAYQQGIKEEQDTEKIGVLQDASAYYAEHLRTLNAQLDNEQWSDSLQQVLYNTPDFEHYYNQVKESIDDKDDTLDQIKELLGKVKEVK